MTDAQIETRENLGMEHIAGNIYSDGINYYVKEGDRVFRVANIEDLLAAGIINPILYRAIVRIVGEQRTQQTDEVESNDELFNLKNMLENFLFKLNNGNITVEEVKQHYRIKRQLINKYKDRDQEVKSLLIQIARFFEKKERN